MRPGIKRFRPARSSLNSIFKGSFPHDLAIFSVPQSPVYSNARMSGYAIFFCAALACALRPSRPLIPMCSS